MRATKLAVALLVSLATFLGGCATRTVTHRVNIPVPVPCRIQWPVEPQPTPFPADANIVTKAKILLADLERRIGYEVELRAAVRSCTG